MAIVLNELFYIFSKIFLPFKILEQFDPFLVSLTSLNLPTIPCLPWEDKVMWDLTHLPLGGRIRGFRDLQTV